MRYIAILVLTLLFNCKEQQAEKLSAQEIIDTSFEVSGSDKVRNAKITYNFRGVRYKAVRNEGAFELSRKFQKDSKLIEDRLSNKGFERYINNKLVTLADSIANGFSASVNSVHYFSVLPYGLNDAAVNKAIVTDTEIKNSNYTALKVTFDQIGGGEDFEDEFVYWINKNSFKVDFLAYSYHEADGKGMRFREAYNERYVEGLRFVDYNNYKSKNNSVDLIDLPNLFEAGTLELVSKIELKNVRVTLLE